MDREDAEQPPTRLELAPALPYIRAAEVKGEALVVAVVTASSGDLAAPGSRILVPETGVAIGSVHTGLDAQIIADARSMLTASLSRSRSYEIPDREIESRVDVFFEVLARRPQLVVAGAGHIAVPLARLAALLDFDVIVIDDRVEYANLDRFPDAQTIIVGPYRESIAGVQLGSHSYVVLVTRGHVHDQACLEVALGADVAYIGMIGSKRRVRTVMAHALERGYDLDRLRAVHAPVGLDIGAVTPAEIAVAIAAEIVNVRRHGRAPSLALGSRIHG